MCHMIPLSIAPQWVNTNWHVGILKSAFNSSLEIMSKIKYALPMLCLGKRLEMINLLENK